MKNDSSACERKNRQDRGAKRRARTRADLLAAARKVFAAKGYHAASILDITTEADVGIGTFYLHFHDKDEVFNTLVDEVLQFLADQVASEIRHYGTISLPIIVRSIFAHAYEQRDLFHIALNRGGQVAQTVHAEDMIAQRLTRTFEQVQAALLLQGYDVHLLARLVTGIIAQGIIWWFDHDEPKPEQMAEQVLKLLAHGLPSILLEDQQHQQS